MFDPEKFGQAMGEAIKKAIAPLQAEIAELKAQLASLPAPKDGRDGDAGRDGKDCDMEAVKSIIEDAVKRLPLPKDGKDGANGKDGEDGKPGERGEKGADGIGLAGAMIDRDGNLLATMTSGEVKNLGPVVGKDGRDGIDGKDGIGLDSFELEYMDETHEIRIKAACAGRVKEVRYPAGGIKMGGYWREGTKAQAGEAWVHDGSLYVAKCATSGKPDSKSDDWIIAARKGRDGETTIKTVREGPPDPIKLKG